MSRANSEPQSPLPHDRHAATTNRRVFMRRVLGGIAIAVPAFRVLASSAVASADTLKVPQGSAPTAQACAATPDAGCPGPCSKTYVKYNGHSCGGNPLSCPTGAVAFCIGHYTIYSAIITGYVCGTFTDDEGPCG